MLSVCEGGTCTYLQQIPILTSVVGTILLALALSKVAILAVNVPGPLLTTLAVALFAIDLLALANGMLTGVGIAALLIDSLMLFDSSDPLLRLLRGYLIKGVILCSVSSKDFVPSVCPSRLAQKRCWGKR